MSRRRSTKRGYTSSSDDEEEYAAPVRAPTVMKRISRRSSGASSSRPGSSNLRRSTQRGYTSSSDDEEYAAPVRAPTVLKRISRRSNGASSSTPGSSSNRGSGREDGRASMKERMRKSQVAQSLQRRPDGKFSPRGGCSGSSSSYQTPPSTHTPKIVSINEASFKTPPNRTPNKTPQSQKMLHTLSKSAKLMQRKKICINGTPPRLLQFDSDSDSEQEDGNQNLTPRSRRSSRSRM